MLQISTGKFYDKSKGLHENESYGILYSKCQFNKQITTEYFSLTPRKIEEDIFAYDLKFINRMEKGGILVKVGDFEYVDQVKLVLTISFNSYFSTNIEEFKRITLMQDGRSDNMNRYPCFYAKKFLSSKIINEEDINKLNNILDNLIKLKRDDYKTIISAARAFHSSFKLLEDDYSLAYSVLIMGLETLATSFDDYESVWENHDQNEREKLDKVFRDMNEEHVKKIKDILIANDFQKLGYRFKQFVLKNVTEDYYLLSASQIRNPIQQEDLESALQNAYSIRSKYAHQLKQVIKNLKETSDVDCIRIFKKIYLTYNGLIRLFINLLQNIIITLEHVDSEDYDWQKDLPGMMDIELQPSMWVTKCDRLNDKNIRKWSNTIITEMYNDSFYDIRDVLGNLISNFSNKTKENKRAILCVYYLYNNIMDKEYRLENYEKFIKNNKFLLEEPCLETLIISSFLNIENINLKKYNCNTIEDIIIDYQKKKNKEDKHGQIKGYQLPNLLEARIYLHLIYMYCQSNNQEKVNEWGKILAYNLTGYYEIQKETIIQLKSNNLDVFKLLKMIKKYEEVK